MLSKLILKPHVVKDHKIMKHSLNSFKVTPIWKDETVFIIGGGPSLLGFNWTSLAGKKTLAVNKAILSYPQANALYWTDTRFYFWYQQEVDNFNGLKFAIRHKEGYKDDIKILNKGSAIGLSTINDTICHGHNSGYAAINLAYLLGAKRIILLGYDMKNDGLRGHYHDGYPVPITNDKVYKDQFIPGFQVLADELKNKNVKVFNASLHSELTVWPKISLEEALSMK